VLVVDADVLDEEAQQLLGLLGVGRGDELVELVGDRGQACRVGLCVGVCGECLGELVLLVA
jgi:hypothetical protein